MKFTNDRLLYALLKLVKNIDDVNEEMPKNEILFSDLCQYFKLTKKQEIRKFKPNFFFL